MTLGAPREGAAVENRWVMGGKLPKIGMAKATFERQKMSLRLQISGCLPLPGVPRKVMVVSYFAETKGVVGCHYGSRLVFKVRDLKCFLN
jgi:hypothetical protein